MTTATRTRKPATAEQQAASAERRAAFRAFAERAAAMTAGERDALAARIGLVTVEGHALSTHNAVLAWMQNPGASVLGGFNQWRAAGRSVRKGEHGIMIWAPGRRREDAEGETRAGFVPIYLFDVSQTDSSEAGR